MKPAPPNPKGHLVRCVRCAKFSTFTKDAVCSVCRNAGKDSGGNDEVSR